MIIDKSKNLSYLTSCASLSFHKSLVGISELKALEHCLNIPLAGGLRISRALSTYYSVYHLMVCMMLLDEEYKLDVNSKKIVIDNGNLKMNVKEEDLNNTSETPEAWKRAGQYERDIATLITHSQIKDYCKNLRMRSTSLKTPFNIVFDNFVKVLPDETKSVKGLFEKLCYIRDRSVYRPSYVINEDEQFIHTSFDIRKEIENLPTSEELYNIITEIHSALAISDNKLFKMFVYLLWNEHVLETEENIKKLGFNDGDIEKYRVKESQYLSFNTFTTHLMELVNSERLNKDYDNIWEPLIEVYKINLNL